jgi:hypothetical protein
VETTVPEEGPRKSRYEMQIDQPLEKGQCKVKGIKLSDNILDDWISCKGKEQGFFKRYSVIEQIKIE